MNTNIVISLDTRRAKKDGSYPLVMRLGHNERTTSIPLGISLQEKYWDDKNRIVRKTYTGTNSVTRINNLIQKKKSEAMDVIMKLHDAGQLSTISVTELRDKIDRPSDNHSFYTYTNHLIEELKKAHRFGTARSYKGVVSVLKEYCGEKELRFQDITYKFLTNFETNHTGKGNTYNGLAVYMRTIRAIFNKAIKENIIEQEIYPFTNYKVKTIPTEKRAIEWDYLKKIIELDIPANHECFNARNYFVASYMMYGMNFSDMAFLTKGDIKNGRILYRRKKTSKIYDIKLNQSLESIIHHYIDKNDGSDFIFPIIKREDLSEQDKDIMWARKRYNKKLKALAKLCGIEQNLTSYVSRHSFATQAMLQEVPVNAISTMLGHSSIKTTQIYLKSLPSNILDDYNARIMGI